MVALHLALSIPVLLCGCRKDADPAPGNTSAVEEPAVVFPAHLRSADETLNEFIERSMTACVEGDYEPFRLLFSAEHEPLTKDQFDGAWYAVSRIYILALEHDPQNDAYAAYARVEFEPELLPPQHELHQNPQRDVVLLIIKEHDEWRLARAPDNVRKWMAARVQEQEPAESGIQAADEIDGRQAAPGGNHSSDGLSNLNAGSPSDP